MGKVGQMVVVSSDEERATGVGLGADSRRKRRSRRGPGAAVIAEAHKVVDCQAQRGG